MASKEEKLRRKTVKRALAASELTTLRESLPMPVSALAELIEYVDEKVGREGCDHTLRHARSFLAARDLDTDTIKAWLNTQGGYCDCEVVSNVSEALERLSSAGEMLS